MTPHVMKRDGCKVPFKSSASKKRFCVQLKQRKSMMPILRHCCCGCQRADAGPQPGGINEIQTAVENQLMSGPYKQLLVLTSSTVTIATLNVKNAVAEPGDPWSGRADQLLVTQRKANKDSKVIPTQRDLLAGIVANTMHASTCCRVTWCRHMNVGYSLSRSRLLAVLPDVQLHVIDLKGMLTQGFKMGNAEIEPRSRSLRQPL